MQNAPFRQGEVINVESFGDPFVIVISRKMLESVDKGIQVNYFGHV